MQVFVTIIHYLDSEPPHLPFYLLQFLVVAHQHLVPAEQELLLELALGELVALVDLLLLQLPQRGLARAHDLVALLQVLAVGQRLALAVLVVHAAQHGVARVRQRRHEGALARRVLRVQARAPHAVRLLAPLLAHQLHFLKQIV